MRVKFFLFLLYFSKPTLFNSNDGKIYFEKKGVNNSNDMFYEAIDLIPSDSPLLNEFCEHFIAITQVDSKDEFYKWVGDNQLHPNVQKAFDEILN